MPRALLILFAGAGSCETPPPPQAPPPLHRAFEAMVDVADPDVEVQLVKGFHKIEWGSGRWTKQSFTVSLKPPRTAHERGATLRVKLDLPRALIEQEESVSLACTIDGKGLTEERWKTSGAHVLTRDVPALTADPVAVTCTVDKKYTAPGDSRELGVVLHAIGLEPN